MHLLIAMKMFNANRLTRWAIIGGQYVFTTILVGVYAVQPQVVHRFVGYLEECAVHTYSQVIRVAETEGTQLNKAWKDLPAPAIAKGYYRLDDNATWIDTVYEFYFFKISKLRVAIFSERKNTLIVRITNLF